jgi:hypothetical protein
MKGGRGKKKSEPELRREKQRTGGGLYAQLSLSGQDRPKKTF